MKKILLLLFFSFSCLMTDAQVAGEYALSLHVDYLKNTGKGMKGIEYRVYVFNKTTQDALFKEPDREFGAGAILEINKDAYRTYTPDLLPKEMYFYTRRWWGWGGPEENYNDTKEYAIGSPRPVFSGNVPLGIFTSSETSIRVTVKPVTLGYWYFDVSGKLYQNTDAVIPDNHYITIKSHTGFSIETYKWEYSLDNTSWAPFPDHVKRSSDGSEVTFKGNDVPNFNPTAANFYVRIHCDTHDFDHRNGIKSMRLTPRRSAPEIDSVWYEKGKCYGENAAIKVRLDRKIHSDEIFYVKINERIEEWRNYSGENNVTSVDGITGDQLYHIALWGGRDKEPFYVGDKAHYADIFVEARKPICVPSPKFASVSCYGGSDGLITIAASRGNESEAKFVATLTDGVQRRISPEISAGDSVKFSGLPKGSYAISLIDENSCTASLTGITIIEPAEPVHIDGGIKPINPTGAETIDGKITFNIGGGDESYEVQVLDHNTKAPIACKIVVDKFSCTISGLGAGSFDLIVTDKVHELPLGQSCGCRVETTVTLTAPPLLVASITEHKPISCYQSNEGQLTAHATGGVIKGALMRYDYAWYNMVDMATQISSDSVARNLYQGAYRVKVTDANNISVLSEPYELFHPDSLHVDLVVQHTDCSGANGGGIQAMAKGGTPPYSYQWSESGQQGSGISGLDVGFYTAIVTDSRGCWVMAHTEIKSPSAIDIQSVVAQPNCVNPSGGGVELKLSGGSAPYTLLWLDNNNTDLKREGLGAGTYKATITDNKGCRAAYEFTLLEPKGFTIALPEDFTMCRNQSRTIKAVCAERDVTYKWYCDAEELAGSGNSITASRAGVYKVVATNQAGCTAQDELSVAVSNESLNLEMIAPTKVAVGTEIHAVNLSTVSAEVLTWSLPKEAIVLKRGDTEAIFMLDKAGHYEIALKGEKNGCSTVVTRTIEVVVSGDEQLPNDKKSLIKQFLVAPNPTKGYFKVQVELHREDDFTMKLYAPSGALIDEKKGVKVQNRSFEYEINGSIQGTYLLHLITPYDKAVLQVIVKN